MSFDDYLKLKDHAQQLRILVEKNAWRLKLCNSHKSESAKKSMRESAGLDGVRLAELMNPIPESL